MRMDKEELIVRIKNAAQALVHQSERLAQAAPTRTDFEATLANVRSLYEYISILNYLQRYGASPRSYRSEDVGLSESAILTQAVMVQPSTAPTTPPASVIPESVPAPASPAPLQEPSPKKAPPMAETAETVLADRLRLMPVDDLRKAISLADKFHFMYELFGGENHAYHAALDTLNNTPDKASAESYLNELADLYKWDPESETVKRFRELVAKRFAV